jgi:hypothetical protein
MDDMPENWSIGQKNLANGFWKLSSEIKIMKA